MEVLFYWPMPMAHLALAALKPFSPGSGRAGKTLRCGSIRVSKPQTVQLR
jgi:hypothetical protein